MNNQNDNRIYTPHQFDYDEWDSRLPVTGSGSYSLELRKERRFVICVITGAFLLMIALFCFFAFSDIFHGMNSIGEGVTQAVTTPAERRFYFSQGEDDLAKGSLSPVYAQMSPSGLEEFLENLTETEPSYSYSHFYNLDGAIRQLVQSENADITSHSHDIRTSTGADAQAFYEIVKKNNSAYLRSVNGYFEPYSEEALRLLCTDIINCCNACIQANPHFDDDMLYCILSELKILQVAGCFDYAMITADNVLFVNLERIQADNTSNTTYDLYLSTLYHEVMHLFQKKCCDCRITGEHRVGLSHNYESLEINPLSCIWLAEAAAEMEMSELLGVGYTAYSENISYVESLNFIASLNEGFYIGRCQELTFLYDYDELFSMLGVDTQKEKKEVLEMMFTIELMLGDSYAFNKKYESAYGINPSDNKEVSLNLERSRKSAVMLTMTKLFYKSLARCVSKGDVTLQDIYYLIKLFEADIQQHLKNDTYGEMAAYGDFFELYTQVQLGFFSHISAQGKSSAEEFTEGLREYSMKTTDGSREMSPYCYLEFLPGSTAEWYTEFAGKVYKKGYYSIDECRSLARECKEEIDNYK